MIINSAKYTGCNDCVVYNVRKGYNIMLSYNMFIRYMHNVIIFYGFKLKHSVYYIL